MLSPGMLNLWNFLQFQLGWFALVLSAAAGELLWGYAALAALLGVHFSLERRKQSEILLLATGALVGLCWETLLQFSGTLRYAESASLIAPLWIIGLWINFAATLNYSLRWLQGRHMLAALFGAIGAPLAFFAGEKLGAVTFYNSTSALLLIATGWAVLTPMICLIAQRLNTCSLARSTA